MMRLYYSICLLLAWSWVQAQPVEIVFWHSMAGDLGLQVKKITDDFNSSQSQYRIKPVYKGEYLESLTSFAAAFRAKQPPALVQVFEVGTSTMLSPKGIIKPVDELMNEQGVVLPKTDFFPVVQGTYSEQGHLMAMPFNTSIPVLFYNADVLSQLGYNAETFPKTWDELEILAAKLLKAGFPCAYTTAYPGWILIESFAAIHDRAMIDSSQTRAVYNNPVITHHLERLVRWQHLHYFEYGGRTDDATTLFTSGHCPLLSQSSGGYRSLAAIVPFKVGVASLPWDNQLSTHRGNNVAGGAAIWVTAGLSATTYQGIAQFFNYLAQPNVQLYWHQHTGYLPIGLQGVYQLVAQASKEPVIGLAKLELAGNGFSGHRTAVPLPNQIRRINDEALEIIFAGIKNPQQAMNDAVLQANHALLRFKRNTTPQLRYN